MYSTSFTPSHWVYVHDSLGRLGQGHYKNRFDESQTISVAEYEQRQSEMSQNPASQKEQNMNNLSSGAGTQELSPWDNPVVGEQAAVKSSTPAPNRPTTAASAPPADQTAQEKQREAEEKAKAEEEKRFGGGGNDGNDDGGKNGGDGGGGGESVICTELVAQGLLSAYDARISTAYAHTYLPPSFMDGYQFWAIPYVRLMRRFPIATRLIVPFVHARTHEVVYRMGKRPIGSRFGILICAVHDTVCSLLGHYVRPEDHTTLYKENAK